MSFLYVGEYPAVEARIVMPLSGLWYVDAHVDAPGVLTGSVVVEAPGLSLSGTVVASSNYGGRVRALVRPGAGRVSEPIGARFFQSATYRQIVAETLREVGESLDDSKLDGVAPAWARSAGPASRTVASVASALGLTWGATDGGLLTLFSPAWNDLVVDTAEVLSDDATTGLLTIGTTDLSARPGNTIEGVRAVAVRHCVSDVVRTEILYSP